MTSVESIGDCSLDLVASASSGALKNGIGASECTLKSSNVLPYINGSGESNHTALTDNGRSTKENGGQEKAHLANGCSPPIRECTIAEIKLPSYVSISCAINGYTNYSKFCRSRDNSPARAALRKSSLENNVVFEENHKSGDFSMDSGFKCTRSHSDCNGTVSSIFRETKQVTVSKQLQIPFKSTRKYMTAQEIMIGGESSTSSKKNGIHDTFENQLLFDKYSLAQEVGNGGPKSLVQQRIESLYGNSELKETKSLCQRESRIDNSKANRKVTVVPSSKRSPSCPPQSLRKVNGSTPPVFRHLTKDFRRQLQGEIPESSNINNPESSILIFHEDFPKGITKSCSENGEKNSNGVGCFLNGESTDECDRAPLSEVQVSSETDPNLVDKPVAEKPLESMSDKAGYRFLDAMDVERKAIRVEIQRLEFELKNTDIPEDACGKIRAACGKANLLLSQKFEQFRELCLKNINELPSVPFYTTASDLAGFWDMVMLQVSDVKATFQDIYAMEGNNWEEITTPKSAPLPPKVKRHPTQNISRSNPCTPKRSTKSVELARARDEARKQLMKAKKKGRQQNGNADDAEIAIFTPN